MSIDYLIRAETKEVWRAYAEEQGWLTNIDGEPVPAEHVRIDTLGPVVITPGTYDEEGNELTPPVMDDWYHVNLRILEPKPEETELLGRIAGTTTTANKDVRAIEGTTEEGAIQVLYPEDITTPIRVWADGMHMGPLPVVDEESKAP